MGYSPWDCKARPRKQGDGRLGTAPGSCSAPAQGNQSLSRELRVIRCSGQGPHLAMTGEPRGFLELRRDSRVTRQALMYRVPTGTGFRAMEEVLMSSGGRNLSVPLVTSLALV